MGSNNNNKSAAVLGAVAMGGNAGGGGGGGGSSDVSSWNGRRGNVYPAAGDYTAAQVNTSEAGKTVQQKIDELEAASTVDDALDPTSTNPVENRVVDQAIRQLQGRSVPTGGAAGDILAKRSGNNYDTEWLPSGNFMMKSTYDTNNNNRVDKADVAYAMGNSGTFVARLKNTTQDTYVITDLEKGVPNGICPLDTNSKIPLTHLPDAITSGMTYGGIFNPQTRVVRLTPQAKEILGVTADTMTLQNSSVVPEGYPANIGLFYITTATGTFASMDFVEGDWLMSLGTEWTQVRLAVRVSSVNGKTGAVTLNSDEVPEGVTNLYLTPALKQKLQDIEDEATKDVNVIQTAQIITDEFGNETLRLVNKNGTVVNFAGGGGDFSEYLKKDGNASETTVRYTPSGSRQAFTGNEKMSVVMAKIVTWLNALEDVAFTAAYNDLDGRPTRVSQFTNDAGYITRTVNNLSNYYTTAQTYTRDEIEAMIDAISSFTFIEVPELPTTGINDRAIYYVPLSGGSGYSRYQHMNGQWLFLGTTDVNMDGYLMSNGNGSNVTVTFTQAAERLSIASGETLAVIMGKLSKYIADMKAICFTASWHDLDDSNELATQDDLDLKVDIQQEVAQAGKVLGIGDDGKVVPVAVSAGVVRKGAGAGSVIGNDSEDDPINTAAGAHATAFGNNVKASGDDQFVTGRFNVEDNNGVYAEIVGNGDPTTPANIRTTDWTGKGWFKNGVSVGNTSSEIVTPTLGNDLTTKTYVDSTVDTKIAEANLLKSMVVTVLPDVAVADPNILYLIEDPTHAETYLTYKKVLESQNPDVWVMAAIGSTQVSASDVQVTELPTPSIAFNNAVYQYIGTSTAYKFGFFYTCKNQSYYCWLQTATGNKFYTKSATPRQYDRIYSEIGETLVWWVESVSGVTLTDSAGNTYTRLSSDDKTQFEWQAVNDKTSDFENNGNGTGNPSDRFITLEETESRYKLTNDGTITAGDSETLSQVNLSTKKVKSITFLNLWNYIKGKLNVDNLTSVTDSTKIGSVDKSKTNVVQQFTASVLFQYMWKKIYPVGTIYTTVDKNFKPGTAFGGTWTLVGADRVLWGTASGGNGGQNIAEQLPNIKGTLDFSGGSQGHPEASPGGAFYKTANWSGTYPMPVDGSSSTGARKFGFDASKSSSIYTDNGHVRPNGYSVFFWRRTA